MAEKMTAENARTFEHQSRVHEMILANAAAERGCTCEAYKDWFTYNRWQAQGFQVQKGEHGIKLTTYVPITKTDKETGERVVVGKRPRTTSVFCRCQVKKI